MEVTIISGIDPYTPKPGGTRAYVMDLIPFLCESEIKTTLIGVSYNKKGNISFKYPFAFVPIVRSQKISSYKFLFNLFLKVPFLRTSKSSIIHINRPDDMLPFVIFSRKNKKICTLHGVGYSDIYFKKGKFIGWAYRVIERYTLKRADRIIAVNENTKNFYTKKYPWLKDKIIIIPIGIDTKLFRPMDKHNIKEKYGFKEEDKIILYVGRFKREKGLDLLLESFKYVKREIPTGKLVLAGDGRERENLKNLVKEFKLNDVIFMGVLEHNKIPEILNCADVFVLCSLFESGPLVIQEAIACAIPVVTTDVGRVREFIKDEKVGKIVERNSKEIAKGILNVLNKADSSETRDMCREVSENCSFEKTAEQTIEVYADL
jgi:glycosyltransferase involved in cell wall biosynthesis